MCETIQTRSDNVYEDDEILTLSLSSNHPNIMTDSSTTRVEIIDDDGKVALCCSYYNHTKYRL